MITYNSQDGRECYFPPLLSNGKISFAPDAEGMLGYSMDDFKAKNMDAFDGIVVRTERRTALCENLQARLFPLGKFIFTEGSELREWSQTLETENGIVKSHCTYSDGTEISSKGFIHPELNIYSLQKKFKNFEGSKRFSYTVTLSGYNDAICDYINVLYTEIRDRECIIGFKMYGNEVFSGEIRFFVDCPFTAETVENGLRIFFNASEGENISFFYYLEDNLHGTDFCKVLASYKQKIDTDGFCGLMSECCQHFNDFRNLGYVKTNDEKLNSIYETSLYSIKCNTTDFSISVGFNNGAWDGRFFAFDEYTSFLGLLGSNHLALAKRVPSYRLNNCLDYAITRASDCHRTENSEDMARFHWESGESDKHELSPVGTWLDHIFHIPLVGIGAFEYFEYSDDKDFLHECRRMIRACAKFITKHMTYKDGDKLYIGKCTDLERLGASVENPFMTACGAIELLQCYAKTANTLGVDKEYANECTYIAQKLRENLPVENDMYVPHSGCTQKSIAVFAGKFPFNVIASNDKKLLSAWNDFELNETVYGNMYPTGKNISPWYACWKALGYARIGNADKAYPSLKQSYPSAGVFDELFEINEPGIYMRPWFATAAGIYVASVNEMLLQSEGNNIKILPAFPHCEDVSFKLAAKGGVTVEATVKGGKLEKAVVLKDNIDVTNQFTIEF